MDIRELRKLFMQLSPEEKVAQTVQLNGSLVVENDVMNTGPMQDLGLPEELNFYEIGAIYNVNDFAKLKRLQEETMKNSKHKIPLLFMSDVIYGFRTIFPIPLAQAGSYDFDLIQQAAEMTAKESYLNGLHVIFSPMLDLSRDPRWGRVMESPGEDVYTAKQFAKSVVTGYQGDSSNGVPENHVAACIKHFAAYGAPEGGREYNTVDMSNQRLFNEYLQPYQAAIEAQTMLVMTAFNVLNGEPSTGSKWLNREILRERFDFDGVLVSDHAAIKELVPHGYAADDREAAKKGLEAGVDFDMMTSVYATHLPELIKEPAFAELLDEAVWRILELKNKLGLFEDPYRGLQSEQTGEILTEEAKTLAVKLVEKSSVLLKNNGSLPLQKDQKIAVVGPYGESRLTLGFWASVSGKPQDAVPLKEGLLKNLSTEQVQFARGYNLFDSYDGFGPLKAGIEMLNGPIEPADQLLTEAVTAAEAADVIVLTFGEQFLESGEGASRTNLHLPEKQVRLIKALKETGKPIVGVLYTGRPLVLTNVEPLFDSLLLVWYPGIMGGIGIANLLTGKANPSARLTMTFPRSEGQIPIYGAQLPTGRPFKADNPTDRFISKYRDESNDPLFAFGEGLSYSSFQGKWLDSEVNEQTINLQCHIKNDSDRTADTVVHVYLNQRPATIVRPIKQLVASEFVSLGPLEERSLNIELSLADLAFYDNQGQKHFTKGNYQLVLAIDGKEESLTVTV
ncbi:glycoside hydrolase family 3 N-terminal domain-containing protein [Enterococcus gallinarum]|uniref:beta-glucosidase n=1 Tax=Enterococcus gallinarum TaxID=1353 RepID=A0A376GXN8_ENTGA|nr:glycoside hydrolase family 3 N-terminal domain-containing protein [Enterococcus gallinarum]STD81674.1 beta-glucosidase [Enterococcus gallinarum]STE01253.1 beta-glucosidase [Enterococcus gallinarum]